MVLLMNSLSIAIRIRVLIVDLPAQSMQGHFCCDVAFRARIVRPHCTQSEGCRGAGAELACRRAFGAG